MSRARLSKDKRKMSIDPHEKCPVGTCSHRDFMMETEVRCEQCGKISVTYHLCNLRNSARKKAQKAARTLDDRIKLLEKGISVPGTTINRVLIDVNIAKRHGLDTSSSNGESVVVWNLGIGMLGEPKAWFFGNTVEEAVTKAEKARRKRR